MHSTCTTTFSVPDKGLRSALWRIYLESFEKAGLEAAQLQACYDETAFFAALDDGEYAKVVVMENGEPVALALLTNNLDKAAITYVNPQRLRAEHPEAAAEGRIWYCTAMVVRPIAQGIGHAGAIIREVAGLLKKHRAVVAFDHSECNASLSVMIARVFGKIMREEAAQAENPPHKVLGGQTYVTMDCFAR